MAPVMATGIGAQPTRRRLLRRKKSAVSEFLQEPAAPAVPPKVEAVEPPKPAVKVEIPTQETAPKPAPAASSAPQPQVAEAKSVTPAVATSALLISREVAEALLAGKSVTVRDVLLEPSFSPTQKVPLSTRSAPDLSAAVAQMEALVESDGQPVEAINLNAPQPAPAPPGDGRAISSAFRRFAG